VANEASTPITTVLVVEDEALIRWDIADYLRDAGLTVLEAVDADEAIRILETSKVQVVFTDISMPGTMDGLRLASYIRDRWPPIKLIVASGHAILSDDDLPANSRFFRKPYRGAQVAQAIGELVRT